MSGSARSNTVGRMPSSSAADSRDELVVDTRCWIWSDDRPTRIGVTWVGGDGICVVEHRG
jgi:hypothetical protein